MSPTIVLFMCCSFFNIICGNFAAADADTTKQYTICSGELYNQFTDVVYGGGIERRILDVIYGTPFAQFYNYYRSKAIDLRGQIIIHTHGKCTSTISITDCSNCLKEAKTQFLNECTHSLGAQTQFKDCRIRYENYYFENDG